MSMQEKKRSPDIAEQAFEALQNNALPTFLTSEEQGIFRGAGTVKSPFYTEDFNIENALRVFEKLGKRLGENAWAAAEDRINLEGDEQLKKFLIQVHERRAELKLHVLIKGVKLSYDVGARKVIFAQPQAVEPSEVTRTRELLQREFQRTYS